MLFQTITIFSLAALSAALPHTKRALKARQSGPVLADTTYDAISISGGKAGNAEQEALAAFSGLDLTDMANIDPADIAFLGAVNDVANDAETEAFNPAIEAATGADGDAISAGKIKNKVLKLMATKLELMAKQAQGEDVAAKLATELKKLNNNISIDKASAGSASTALPFTASISGGSKASSKTKSKAAVVNTAADEDEEDAEDDAEEDEDED
ncbi:hypothetical protein P153DRAFT_290808 [Dothidotthia symphoricarpi CBS 119687]|uniref:Small secreted protein n=1 Tax=Dothidotthia symphoricarpi CBS 119687 TaxID=1392245 RepID=A0A6A6AGC0_9PLEO|nr:uncharacterized protein P153DRAFT_290808 [Dothidotthia symphoricarpi CBS 119687]KAF2129471.1 hypothetical protein P153DRAFT_290808 [Dothidotthia symphoricarpi CBS 119687]